MTFLLNADVGEGLESDNQLYPYLDQASIACGGHTGDAKTMRIAVKACIEHGVEIGAHPSYPDKANFGRKSVEISDDGLVTSLTSQLTNLLSVCHSLQAQISYIKPHGALYNDIMSDVRLFDLILQFVDKLPVKLDLMLSASPRLDHYQERARQLGVTIINEAFADRQYCATGHLVSRALKGSVYDNTQIILSQVAGIKKGKLIGRSGEQISIEATSICLHGDNQASVYAVKDIAQLLRI